MDAFNLTARLTLDTSQYDEALGRVRTNVPQIGNDLDGATAKASKFGNAIAGAAKVAGAALAAATTAVTAFAKSSVDVGAGFDSAMSQVAATMGKTMSELKEEIGTTDTAFGHFEGNLREFAEYMGANTAFSATQAAEALNYMALAGYDAQTSMQMLPNVLNLAAAGGMELASASDMVTDAQSALGLSLDETTQLVDKMAMASSKSNTSVAQLGEAMLTIGGTAKQLSGGTTELAAALGILADNGTKGAEGGTALRNILKSFASEKFEKSFGALGVSAYDANGEMRPLKDTLADMNAVMSNMSTQEKTSLINKVFNSYDLAKVNALLDTSIERWDELTGTIDNAAASASQMAETQLDNLAGNITLFNSALEGVQITISEHINPTLTEFVKYGSEALSTLNQAFKESGLEGAMNELPALLDKGLAMVFDKLPMFIEAGAKVLGALVSGIINNLPALIDGAKQIVVTLADDIANAAGNVADAGGDIVVSLVTGITQSAPQLLSAAVTAVDGLATAFTDPENLEKIVNSALDLTVTFVDGLVNAIPRLADTATTIITNLVEYVLDPQNMAKIADSALKIVIALGEGIVTAAFKLVDSTAEIVKSITDTVLKGDWKGLGENVDITFANAIIDNADAVTSAWDGMLGTIDSMLGTNLQKWSKDVQDWAFDVGKQIYNVLHPDANASVRSIEIKGNMQNAIDDAIRQGYSPGQALNEGLSTLITTEDFDIYDKFLKNDFTLDKVQARYDELTKISSEAVNKEAQNVKTAMFIPTEAIRQMSGEAATAITTLPGWVDRSAVEMNESVKSVSEGVTSSITTAGETATSSITTAGETATNSITTAAEEGTELVKDAGETASKLTKDTVTFATKNIGEYSNLGIAKQLGTVLTEEETKLDLIAQKVWDATKDATERRIKNEQLNYEDQARLWEQMRDQFVENSDQWIAANDKMLEAERKAADESSKLESERTKKLAEEQKKKTDAIKQAVNEQISAYKSYSAAIENINSEILEIQKRYDQELQTEIQKVFNSYSLFEKVPERIAVSGQELLKNLQDQNNSIKLFEQELETFAARGVSSGLVEYIRSMGVDALDELEGLLQLSDKELAKYDKAYKERMSISTTIATDRLEPMKAEMDAEIATLMEGANEAATQFAIEYGTTFLGGVTDAIITGAGAAVEQVKETVNSIWNETFGTDTTANLGTVEPELTANMTVTNENHFEFKINGIQYQNMQQLAQAVSNEFQKILTRRNAGYAGT